MLGGVGRQIDLGLARMRRAVAATSLIEQDDAERVRIEQPAMPRRARRPGATVQNDCRRTCLVPAGLPVDALALADFEETPLVRLDLREQRLRARSPPAIAVRQCSSQ
jgi:hypothetical protein